MTGATQARRSEAGRLPDAAPCATFYYTVGGGDSYWRCEAPAKVLGARLAGVPEAEAERAFTHPNWNTSGRTAFPWQMDVIMADGTKQTVRSKAEWARLCADRSRYVSVKAVFPLHEGVAVWTRPDAARGALMLAMQDQGIRTLSETDDNYFADPSQNISLRRQAPTDKQRLAHARGMAMADAMVFSTRALRDIYHRELKERVGKKHLPESYVCRNSLPASDWPERVERDGPLRVGWMGSNSHLWDIQLAFGAFHAAKEAGCETVTIGYDPSDPDPQIPDVIETDEGPVSWRSEKSIEYKTRWGEILTRTVPWIAPEAYHRAGLPLDVMLCPLRTDGFTLGKSDVKAVEGSISGAAVICSQMPVFQSGGWKHRVNCLMAGSPQEFAEQMLILIKDEGLRYELVTAAQEMILTDRSETTIRREWGDALAL